MLDTALPRCFVGQGRGTLVRGGVILILRSNYNASLANAAKRAKDLYQGSALFDALAEHRAHDLAAAWNEAYGRGPQWRKHLRDALSHLDPLGRDRLLYATGQTRSIVSGLDIEFHDAPPRYDFLRDLVLVPGLAGRQPKDYSVSREALDDWFGSEGEGPGHVYRHFATIVQRLRR